jgi:hypothetical protein
LGGFHDGPKKVETVITKYSKFDQRKSSPLKQCDHYQAKERGNHNQDYDIDLELSLEGMYRSKLSFSFPEMMGISCIIAQGGRMKNPW